MQRAAGVVHTQPVAQGIERIALAGEHFLGHHQRVGHAGHEFTEGRLADELQFLVQETDVEGRVVDDDLGILQVGQDFLRHLGELGLVAQEFVADAVHPQRVFVAVALRVEVEVQVVAGELAVEQLHTADFNDAVAAFGGQARGFSVKNDLAHGGNHSRPAP